MMEVSRNGGGDSTVVLEGGLGVKTGSKVGGRAESVSTGSGVREGGGVIIFSVKAESDVALYDSTRSD
jgi:hypothetical protein